MQHKHEASPERIEAISRDADITLTWTPDTDDPDLAIASAATSVEQAVESEGTRQLLAESFDGFAALAEQVGGPTADDWLADIPNRIQEGLGDSVRDDVVYQSRDWEEATGKRDNPIVDLIGG